MPELESQLANAAVNGVAAGVGCSTALAAGLVVAGLVVAGESAALERERTGQTALLGTDDCAEGMRAFSERRRAQFRGR